MLNYQRVPQLGMVSNYPLMDMKWYKHFVVVDWFIVGFMASMVSTVYYWVYHHEIWNSLSRPSFITILINITSPFWFHELPASNPWTCLFLQYSTWFSKVYRGFPIAMLWCLFPFRMQVSPLFSFRNKQHSRHSRHLGSWRLNSLTCHGGVGTPETRAPWRCWWLLLLLLLLIVNIFLLSYWYDDDDDQEEEDDDGDDDDDGMFQVRRVQKRFKSDILTGKWCRILP